MSLDDDSDEQLARAVASRSDAARPAEEVLCRRLAPRVRAYGLRHLRDHELVSELVQRVLVILLRALRDGRVERPEHVHRFLLGTCRNVSAELRRGGAREVPLADVDERALPTVAMPEPADPPRIEPLALSRCLDALGAREQRVLLLTFHEDRSAGEIATELAVGLGNLRVIRHRAIARLRTCLGLVPREAR